MRVICTNGHEVCDVPDEEGWSIDADNFTNYAKGQYHIQKIDPVRIVGEIPKFQEIETAGRCFCGAAYSGLFPIPQKEEKYIFKVHTKEGWV